MLKQHPKMLGYIAQIADATVLVATFFLAFPFREWIIRWLPYGSRVDIEPFIGLVFLHLFVWWVFLKLHGVYGPQRLISFRSLVAKVFRASILATLIIFSFIYILKWTAVPRTLVLTISFLSLLGLLGEKFCWLKFLEYLRKEGKGYSDVLIVGVTKIARHFVESTNRFTDWGLRVVGFLSTREVPGERVFCGAPILGSTEDLTEILHQHPVDEVIFAVPSRDLENAREMIDICEMEGVKTRIISDFFRGLVFKAEADVIHGIPIITYSPSPMRDWQLLVKRILDVLGATVGLLLVSPLLVVTALLVKITSRGPVFYRWEVAGLNKKPITSYKFRTMVVDADELKHGLSDENEMEGPVFKMRRDPRVTRIGKVLRKFSLDELPQLWSVLKGDLSLVGPHPPLQSELHRFDDWHRRKLSVKPGLTCLWQINGRSRVKDFDEWVLMDLEYIDNWSLWRDFTLLLKTVPAVLKGTGL